MAEQKTYGPTGTGGVHSDGHFKSLPPRIEVSFANGTSLQGPAGFQLRPGILDDVDDVIKTICKVFPDLAICGGGDNGGDGGKPGCYFIKLPDGTTIEICPAVVVAVVR